MSASRGRRHRQQRVWLALTLLGTMLLLALARDSSRLTLPPRPVDGWSVGVEAWITDLSSGQHLAAQPVLPWRTGGSSAGSTVVVDPARRYQTMVGFGAAMTDSSAHLLSGLPTGVREQVMTDLFSRSAGIGLSILRQPIGASDFTAAAAPYSYDDQPPGVADPELSDFSIDHDRAEILPRLREAYAINPDLTFIASPWSAPAWMKDSGSLVSGSLLPEHYQTYANYLVKFVQAYQQAGIPTDYLSIINEPLHAPLISSGMPMSAQQAADFIGDHLGPALHRDGLSTTAVLGYDHNWDNTNYPGVAYSTDAAKRYVAGTAWHCYAGDVVSQTVLHNDYPWAQTFETECSGGRWQGTTAEAFDLTMASVIGVPRHWGRSVVLWNLALDERGGPFIGECFECRGVITVHGDGRVEREVDFWALAHASRFVQPGAVRLGSSNPGLQSDRPSRYRLSNVAFENPDGSQVLVAHNSLDVAKEFSVRVGDRHFTTILPAGAAATYRWRSPKTLPAAGSLGWADLDLGPAPPGSPTDRLVQTIGADTVDSLNHVLVGGRWLAYSLPAGADIESSGPSTRLPRDSWRITPSGTEQLHNASIANITDGKVNSRWSSGTGQTPGMRLTIDLGSPQSFTEIELDSAAGDHLRRYEVRTSVDGVDWTEVARGQGRPDRMTIPLPHTEARYLQVISRSRSGHWWSIHELNLNAGPVEAPGRDSVPRDLATAEGQLPDGTRLVSHYNRDGQAAVIPWPVDGLGFTYRLSPAAAVTFAVRTTR